MNSFLRRRFLEVVLGSHSIQALKLLNIYVHYILIISTNFWEDPIIFNTRKQSLIKNDDNLVEY